MPSYILVSSFPYFSSDHTPVHNSEYTIDELKHKRKYMKFAKLSNTYNIMINVNVYSVCNDVRSEYLCIPLPNYMLCTNDVELSEENNYTGCMFDMPIKVLQWNAPTCKIEIRWDNSSTFTSSQLVNFLKDPEFIERERENMQCNIFMCDDYNFAIESLNPIQKINIVMMTPQAHERIAPHYPACVETQNLCGYCILPHEIIWESLKPVTKKRRGLKDSCCETILTTSGSYVLTSLRFKIDFRGVRSIKLVDRDMQLLSNLSLSDVSTYVYMMVLKASIGKGMYFRCENDASYLQRRIHSWCSCKFKWEDVCDVLEISNIIWEKLEEAYPYMQICNITKNTGTLFIFVSRKGGAIIRLTFPKMTKWDIFSENDVISDCNKLMQLLHSILSGKR